MNRLTPSGSEAQDQELERRSVGSAPSGTPGRSHLGTSQSAPNLHQDRPGSSGGGSMRSSASGRFKEGPYRSPGQGPASREAVQPSAWLADPRGKPGARLG